MWTTQKKEKLLKINELLLTECDIFQSYLNLKFKNEKIGLKYILKVCSNPRATFLDA